MRNKVLFITIITLIIFGSFIYSDYIEDRKIEQFINDSEAAFEEYENHLNSNLGDITFVKEFALYDTCYGFLTDNDYTIIYHPNEDIIGVNLLDILPEIKEKLENHGNKKLISYEFSGVDKLMYLYYGKDNRIFAISANLEDIELK